MKTKVKTIWGPGIVSVNEKYVKEALLKNEGLEIECNGTWATISYDELKSKRPRKDKLSDKFWRRRECTLYDFFWNDYKNEAH
jgi:hypothetical protein